MNLINFNNVKSAFASYAGAKPFDHVVIDDFFNPGIAERLESEFPDYNDSQWFVYRNAIEDKKAQPNWNLFPAFTYQTFRYLNSDEFVNKMEDLTGLSLYPDPGLHGAGWHIHSTGGKLNPHLDYNIHPKLGLQRVLNIIMYMTPEFDEAWGGHFGLWNSSQGQPDQLLKEVAPKFNRAIIFNTTQNSWHGLSRPLAQPQGIYRKSLAIYYLTDPPINTDPRGRALFAPTENQKNDSEVLEIIRLRSDLHTSKDVYVKK